jgi:hypothetical protein
MPPALGQGQLLRRGLEDGSSIFVNGCSNAASQLGAKMREEDEGIPAAAHLRTILADYWPIGYTTRLSWGPGGLGERGRTGVSFCSTVALHRPGRRAICFGRPGAAVPWAALVRATPAYCRGSDVVLKEQGTTTGVHNRYKFNYPVNRGVARRETSSQTGPNWQ